MTHTTESMSTESMVTQAALEIAREAHAQRAERDDAHHTARAFRAGSYDKGGTMPVALLAATLALRHRTAAQPEREAVLEGWLVERLSGEGYGKAREVLDARQYDPSEPGFFLNEEARGQYRVSPLFAALTTPAPNSEREAVLEEALRPFAREAQQISDAPDLMNKSWAGTGLSYGDWHRAAAALKTTPAPAVSRDEIVAVLEGIKARGLPDRYKSDVELNDRLAAILSRLQGEGE